MISFDNLLPFERRAMLEDIGRIGLALGRELPEADSLPASVTDGSTAPRISH